MAKATFWRGAATWKVPTIGPSAIEQASNDSDGIAGSCRWRMSNSPLAIHCRTRDAATGPKSTRATAPLYGIATGLPAYTTLSSLGTSSSVAGARIDTSWPSRLKYWAKSRMCAWTPPGISQAYGETKPIRIYEAAGIKIRCIMCQEVKSEEISRAN